jgi:two-component system, NtrC family, sensor kinase
VTQDFLLEGTKIHGVHVLIIDDEMEFADSLAERLSLRGMKARASYSGTEGIADLDQKGADFVILDLNMQGMNGLEVLSRIKSLQGDKTEVIILTGHSSVASAIEGMKLGAFDYLEKPIDALQLIETILRAQDNRVRKLERLRMIDTARLASLAQMSIGVAHEINNPLNIILQEVGLIQDLIKDGDIPHFEDMGELQGSLSIIAKQIRRCKKLTMRILSLRRPSSQRTEKTDLKDVIAKELESRNEQFAKLGIQEKTEFSSEIPLLAIPSKEIEEALRHVVDNALDAMDPGGGTLTLRTRAETDMVVIEIEDTGLGIPEGILSNVFEPFYSTKEISHGNGLGLSISQSIILNLGGTIEINSIENRGTQVVLKLPIVDAKNESTDVTQDRIYP